MLRFTSHSACTFAAMIAVLLARGAAQATPTSGDPAPPSRSVDDLPLTPQEKAALRAATPDMPEDDPRPPEQRLLPLGVWIARPGTAPMFSYVDPKHGASLAGDVPTGEGRSRHIVIHLFESSPDMTVMTDAAVASAGLPPVPEWLTLFGPQPPPGSLWGTWRLDPRLRDRFTQEGYPDDLEIVIYDGTLDNLKSELERAWVRVRGCEEDICTGELLSEPIQIPKLREGQTVRFLIVGADKPLLYIPE